MMSEMTELIDTFFNGRPAKSSEQRIAIAYEELKIALAESVKLQSHYASLLNTYDGGERMIFKNAREWLERLHETKVI